MFLCRSERPGWESDPLFFAGCWGCPPRAWIRLLAKRDRTGGKAMVYYSLPGVFSLPCRERFLYSDVCVLLEARDGRFFFFAWRSVSLYLFGTARVGKEAPLWGSSFFGTRLERENRQRTAAGPISRVGKPWVACVCFQGIPFGWF